MAGVSFEYIDGEGGTFALATASPRKRKLMGFGGVGLVAPEHFWQPLPDRDGEEHLGHRVPRRTMNFMCKSAGTSRAAIWQEKRDWAEAFSLDKGQGRIKATLPNGSIFQTYCRYAGGLDFSTEDSEIPTVQGFPVQLVADSVGVGTINVNVNVTAGGGTLVVNCETPSVRHGSTGAMGSATTSSYFYELARGSNTVHLTATSGSGECKAEWTEKYAALKP